MRIAVPILLLSGFLFAGGLFSGEAAAGAAKVVAEDDGRPVSGTKAPRFRLNDHNGNLTPVGGAREDGRWTVLAFYPKALTPG